MSPYLSGKSAILILVLALTFLLAACGGAESVGTVSSDGQSVSNAAARNDPQSETILVEEGRPDAKLTAETLAKAEIQAQQTDASLPMEKLALGSVAAKDAYVSGAVVRKAAAVSTPVYRFFNSTTGAHFYTSSAKERDNIMASGTSSFRYEGEAFRVASGSSPGLSPVHRFFNTRTGVHFYTISEAERANVVATLPQYRYEGVAYYASLVAGAGLVPMHRFFVAGKGFHFYTASGAEKNSVQANLSATYRYEGIGYYVFGDDSPGETLPSRLISVNDLSYEGAFLVPEGTYGVSSADYAEGPIALDGDGLSMFLVGHAHQQAIAEITIPNLSKDISLSGLQTASYKQNYVNLFNRASGGNPQGLNTIGGMASIGGKLFVNAYEYYGTSGGVSQTTMVVQDAEQLAASPVAGFHSFPGAAHASGWMSPVPSDWHVALGGPMLTGFSSGVPIIDRLSAGPSAFTFDPQAVVQAGNTPITIPSSTLLDYSLEHVMGMPMGGNNSDYLYNQGLDNKLWTHLSKGAYGFIVPGTATYLVVGSTAGIHGGICYKDSPLCRPDCPGYCSLQANDVQGAYYWMFNVADLKAVLDGRRASYSVIPYAYGEIDLPGFAAGQKIIGGAYDSARKRLYLNLHKANGTLPVIAAVRIS